MVHRKKQIGISSILFIDCTTGVATIKIRIPDKNTGGRLITLQMKLDVLVEELYTEIGVKLNVSPNL